MKKAILIIIGVWVLSLLCSATIAQEKSNGILVGHDKVCEMFTQDIDNGNMFVKLCGYPDTIRLINVADYKNRGYNIVQGDSVWMVRTSGLALLSKNKLEGAEVFEAADLLHKTSELLKALEELDKKADAILKDLEKRSN